MRGFKVTSPSPDDGHYHIVFIDTDQGIALFSPGSDGSGPHEATYDPPREPTEEVPPTPPQIDPMTQQPVLGPDGMPDQGQPGQPADPGKEEGSWIVGPAPDGHTHEELVDYSPQAPEKKEEKASDIIADCIALWKEALEVTGDSHKDGEESEDFYQGKKQWKDATRRKMEANDRACLTLNEIQPNIDTLIGYQVEQRTDPKALPQEGSDQRVADMISILLKRELDNCQYQREKTKIFKDQSVVGKGVFNVYPDFEETPEGTLKVRRFPWADAHYGPHEEDDLSDCEYGFKSRMRSIASIKKDWPDKAEEVEGCYKEYQNGGYRTGATNLGMNGTNTDYKFAKTIDGNAPYTVDGTFPLVDVQKKQFRVAECWRAIYIPVTVLFHPDLEFYFTAQDWNKKDVALVEKIPGFYSLTQNKKRFRITRFCGGVVLSDEKVARLPKNEFFFVPVYAYRQNGQFWGKVEIAKDPQREINKRRSQMMDAMNRLGAAIYFIEPDGMFKDSSEKEKFKKHRSKPGAIFEVQDATRTPKIEEGAEIPSSLVTIMQMDQQNLQRLMNVVVQQEGANESGTMLLEKKKSRLTGNNFLFDNLAFTEQKVMQLAIAVIQQYYSPERIQRILNSQYSREKFKIGGDDFAKYSKQEIIEMLKNADLTQFDIIITESSFSASTRLGIAKVIFELIEKGAEIPPDLAIEFIDMPADIRSRINERMGQQSEQSAQAETDKNNTEVKKTLIAKGQYTVTPEEAQKMGLIPAAPGAVSETPSTAGTQPVNNAPIVSDPEAQMASQLASSLAGG